MKKLPVFFFLASLVFLNACQKEKSFESGTTPSEGLLQSDVTGDCLPKNVVGTYEQGTALNGTTNYIEVTVDVTTTGSFTVYTDTVNGVYFRATGTFTSLGPTVVKLRGNLTPAAQGTFNFSVFYNGQFCSVPVIFLPSGAGGPAVFTLNCTTPPTPAGSYGVGLALNSSNQVVLNVNVTTIGTYNVTSNTVNGMTFSGSSALTATGAGTITLTGTGTPTTAGAANFTVTVGTTTCNFTVTVASAAAYTMDCASIFVDGSYIKGQALTSTNTVDIDLNVTTAGAYSITTAPVNGMTFSGSGTLAVGLQTITLTGTGTPTADGSFVVTVPGTPSCTFTVDVDPGMTIDWKFTEGTVTYQGSTDGAEMTILVPPIITFAYLGSNTTDDIIITLNDVAGGIQVNETYTSSATTTNLATFQFIGATETYTADPSTTGVTLTAKVTAHNTTTKTISGTFSGTVKNAANVTKTISNGQFTATYP